MSQLHLKNELSYNPVDRRHCFNVDATSYDVVRRCIDVETASCVYWESWCFECDNVSIEVTDLFNHFKCVRSGMLKVIENNESALS